MCANMFLCMCIVCVRLKLDIGGGVDNSRIRYVTQGGRAEGAKWPKLALRNFWTAPLEDCLIFDYFDSSGKGKSKLGQKYLSDVWNTLNRRNMLSPVSL